jgi:hypothetical protein
MISISKHFTHPAYAPFEIPTVPRIWKNFEGSSFPICTVLAANTPNGNVNPHHPILNGKLFDLIIEADAKNNQTSPNAHRISATKNPNV